LGLRGIAAPLLALTFAACGGDEMLETDTDTGGSATSDLTQGSSSSANTGSTEATTGSGSGDTDQASSSGSSETQTSDEVSTDPTDPTDSLTDSTGSETGDPICEPWAPGISWIGADCGHDLDCDYDESVCLLAEEGFPCGTCSQPCDALCPDQDGAPVTFCIDATDVGFGISEGLCVSQCDPEAFAGNGCREGYACVPLQRYENPGVIKSVCIPEEFEPPKSECLEQLDELGIVYTPTQVALDHPDGFPNLDCIIEDPVYLHSPVADVGFRYYSSDNESPVLVSCTTALAIYEMATIMGDMGGTEFEHIGTYNCRVIGGTQVLSEHAFARAIDLYGFLTEDDSYYTLEDDWEKFEPNPMTAGGIWLKELMDACHEMGIWNIILTPNYNDAHYNHFHVDLTPGSDFYE